MNVSIHAPAGANPARNLDDTHIQQELQAYRIWRLQVSEVVHAYRAWLERSRLNTPQMNERLAALLHHLSVDRVTVAFVAEFSRGKTELINALFFAATGVRLLPSAPGRTTMCPTEIYYDRDEPPYIRLLPIETRLDAQPLSVFKQQLKHWVAIPLDCTSVTAMQQAFKELAATRSALVSEAAQLGLLTDEDHQRSREDWVDIPRWRHALISFPHPLLQEGLAILDTPGLNALGSEPELTLNMLPSAQGIVFVLSADTGVSKSDMEMWRQHVRGSAQSSGQDVVVVMNKTDTLQDELQSAVQLQRLIAGQVDKVAETLAIPRGRIFPLSAKHALVGRVRQDAPLVAQSGVAALENYLADQVVARRRAIMRRTVDDQLVAALHASERTLHVRLRDLDQQLADIRNIDVSNHSTLNTLMLEIREQQSRYMTSVEDFQASRRVLSVQMRLLQDALSLERVDRIIQQNHRDMAGSLFTVGMKAAMKAVLVELQQLVQRATASAQESQTLVQTIYRKFADEHGLNIGKPVAFDVQRYALDLERLLAEGEAFRQSSATLVLEQNVAVRRLYEVVIARARDIFAQAGLEAANWGAMVLSPLVLQIKEHKLSIEARLETLRKISESTQSLDETLIELEQQQTLLHCQAAELRELSTAIT